MDEVKKRFIKEMNLYSVHVFIFTSLYFKTAPVALAVQMTMMHSSLEGIKEKVKNEVKWKL